VVDDGSSVLAPPLDDSEPPAERRSGALPPVVVVLVTHDPGPWFEETLRSLEAQTYSALSVLIIDAASEENPTARIASVLPTAYVRRIDRNDGFASAANEVLGSVEGAAFYVICHDDVALAPDAIRTLVEEAFRSNAGIAGPKLVAWDAPGRIRQVGAAVDKAGVLAPYAEPGELDQEQHDAVRDVFVVPGACTLVRADLFAALGGFDPGIDYLGEDLDLCWRAHVAGARVLIVPAAQVRHLEALGVRREVDDRRRLQARHRLRTMLACYRPLTLVRVVPQAAVMSVVEGAYALAAGQPRQAADVLGAWTWNLRRLGQVRARRRAIRPSRSVPDREVRELQVRGSARLTAFIRGQIGKGDDRLAAMTRSGRQFAGALRARSSRAALVVGAIVLAIVAVGSRNLIRSPIPAVGELADFPPAHVLLEIWRSTWRSSSLGTEGPAPPALGVLGALSWVLGDASGLVRQLLVLVLIPIGIIGAWRLARPIGSLRAGIAAFVVYAAVPVPYNAMSRGSWSGLVAYAAAPWVLLQLVRASQLAPFGRADLTVDSPEASATPQSRSATRQILVLGLILAAAGSFVPFVVVVAFLGAVALALGSLVAGRPAGAGRTIGVAAGAVVTAVLLQLPWSYDVVGPHSRWDVFAGIGAAKGGGLSIGALLRFETGPHGGTLGYAFLVAAALPLLIGRGWRFEWAVRAWFVALGAWALAWTAQAGWFPVPLPPVEVLIAMAGAGLAMATAMGMAAFEVDLPGYRFGWRQAVSSVAALAVLFGILPIAAGIGDGRWKMPPGDLDRPVQLVLGQASRPPGRILWVGDPGLVPAAGFRYDDRLTYATSEGVPTVEARWATADPQGSDLPADALRLALTKRTSRVGELLAPMGIQFVIVPQSNTPSAYSGVDRPAPRSLLTALSEQLDLVPVETDVSIVVYRNTAYRSMVTLPPKGSPLGDRFTDAATDGVTRFESADLERTGRTTWEGSVSEPGDVLMAEGASDRWRLESAGGRAAERSTAYGWAQQFTVDDTGRSRITHTTPAWYPLLVAVQIVLWLGAAFWVRRTSPRRAARKARRAATVAGSGT
jgi:GT2 family glycosyltransferase